MSNIRAIDSPKRSLLNPQSAGADAHDGAPDSVAFLGALQIFCKAILEIEASGEAETGPSPLTAVLPSLGQTFSRCSSRAAFLREELEQWTARSQRLARLARWYCRNGGEGIVERLDWVQDRANRLVAALEALHQPCAASEPVEEAAELIQFCRAVVELATADADQPAVLAQLFPTMHLLFGRCTREQILQLRSELADSEAQVEQLIHMAALHCEIAAGELRRGAQRTHAAAACLLDALEILALPAAARPAAPSRTRDLPAPRASAAATPSKPNATKPANGRAQADLYYRMGLRCHRQKLLPAAEKFYTQSLAYDLRHRLAWRHRGQVRLADGRSAEAVADLTKALELDAADVPSLVLRGDALVAAGRFREALADYSRSLKLSPKAVGVRLKRAAALREMGELDRAWNELERMRRDGVDSAPLHFERGLVCRARGQRDQAAAAFRAALAADPGFSPALRALERLPQNAAPAHDAGGNGPAAATGAADAVAARSAGAKPAATRQATSNRGKAPAGGQGSVEVGESSEQEAELSNDDILEMLQDPVRSSPNAANQQEDAAGWQQVSGEAHTEVADEQSRDEYALVPIDGSAESEPPPAFQSLDASSSNREPTKQGLAKQELAHHQEAQHQPARAKDHHLEIKCPNCGQKSSMPWERMHRGKVFGCPRCHHKLVVREGGRLAKVRQDEAGNWELDVPPPFWKNRRTVAGAAAVVVIALLPWPVLMVFAWRNAAAKEPIAVPPGLEPRAVAFGEAWLARDYQMIRLLTVPAQQGDLFGWLRSNAPPEHAAGAEVRAAVVEQGPQAAVVELSFAPSVASEGSGGPLELRWQQTNEQWLFAPAAGAETTAAKRHLPQSRSEAAPQQDNRRFGRP